MNIIEVDNVKKYLSGSRFIGVGTTAVCFLMRDGRVLKLYRDTYRTYCLFKNKNMFDHLEYLSTLNNDSYIGPTDVLVKDNNIIGFIMSGGKIKTIRKMPLNTKISNIMENYEKLLDDTLLVCESNYRLFDLHDKNLLYSDTDGFKVIDLDGGNPCTYFGRDDLFNYNACDLSIEILKAIYGVKFEYDINFWNCHIDEKYKVLHSRKSNSFREIMKDIEDSIGGSDLRVRDLRCNKRMLRLTKKPTRY